MNEIVTSLIWFGSWPVVIYVSYRFIWMNVRRLAELETRL